MPVDTSERDSTRPTRPGSSRSMELIRLGGDLFAGGHPAIVFRKGNLPIRGVSLVRRGDHPDDPCQFLPGIRAAVNFDALEREPGQRMRFITKGPQMMSHLSGPWKPLTDEPQDIEIEKIVDRYLEIPDDYRRHEGDNQNRIERVEKEIQWMPLYRGGTLYVPSELQVGSHTESPTICYFTR